MLQDIIINGLVNGSIYALLAIGFSLIFGVARIVNIAHTAFYMLAAYFIYIGFHYLGAPPVLAIVLAVPATVLTALVCFRLFIDPIQEHEAAVLIATIALAMVIQEALLVVFGGHYLGVPPLISGYVELLGVRVTKQHVLALGFVLVALALVWVLLMRTRIGLAIRVTAQDREIANLMGMDVRRVAMVTMAVSVMLAAVAGAIVVPLTVLDPHMWMHPLIMMLAIVVLGGVGSVKGSLLGSFILGFAEALVVFLIPMGAFLKGSVALSIMILVLLIRPEGLFGVAFEEER
ncbi:MAG: branched-chain amino acid ABC transporter permease [Deltaproteobacteria bacterium]|nr:branched-chain amino acid ABC transporter permease [Deltaproteobacteria bacterium]